MERVCYERGINKLATSMRIFDDSLPERMFSKADLHSLYHSKIVDDHDELTNMDWLNSKDPLLAKICTYKCIEHDSLLNITNEVLSKRQKSEAITLFKKELEKPMYKCLRRNLMEAVRYKTVEEREEIEEMDMSGSSDEIEDDDNENANKTVYGFQKDTFLRVLFLKAREDHPTVEPDHIYMTHIPAVLQDLYFQMDVGNKEVRACKKRFHSIGFDLIFFRFFHTQLYNKLMEIEKRTEANDRQLFHLKRPPQRKTMLINLPFNP